MPRGCRRNWPNLVKSGFVFFSLLVYYLLLVVLFFCIWDLGFPLRDCCSAHNTFFLHVKSCATRMWKPKCSLDVYSRENGFFFFKFDSKDECDRVLHGLFDGRLIILKRWCESYSIGKGFVDFNPNLGEIPFITLEILISQDFK